MTMRLGSIWAKLAATLMVSCCLITSSWGQGKPAKAGQKSRIRKTASASVPVPESGQEVEKRQAAGARRDPFLPLVTERREAGNLEHLPPGKAGLVITTLRVDGTVSSQEGMLAVLSNAEQHVYFVREGDQLYDGRVDKIGLDGVTFRQNSKDAFGKPVERMLTKRIYASAGEQQ